MQEPLKALTQSYTRTKAKDLQGVPRDDGAAHQLVEQHDLRRRGRQHRLLPRQLHSQARPEVRLDASRWTAAIRRRSGRACTASTRRPCLLNPAERVALQHQQLALVGGRAEQPEEGGLSRRTWSAARREARGASTPSGCCRTEKDFTLDSLIAAAYDSYLPAFEEQIPALLKAWDGAAGEHPLKAKLAEQIAAAARVGLPVVRRLRARRRWRSSGAKRSGGGSAPTRARRACPPTTYVARQATAPSSCSRRCRRRPTRSTADFGTWKTPWGEINRFQRLTGRHRPAVQRRAAEHPGGLHVGAVGLAGVVRRAHLPPARRRCTARAGTASWPWSSSATACGPGPSRPAGRAAIPRRRTSTIRPTRYSTGNLRDVYFYREQLEGHIEREYKPGK